MKGSEQEFYDLVCKLYDNSMGDMNYFPFDFIDEKGLQEEFKQYLVKGLSNEAEIRAEEDAESEDPMDKLYDGTILEGVYKDKYLETWMKYHPDLSDKKNDI